MTLIEGTPLPTTAQISCHYRPEVIPIGALLCWKSLTHVARWAEACAETQANAVLTVLRVRGIAVSDVARERILAEKDLEQLNRWLEKAIVASSVTEMLDSPGSR